MPWIIAGGLLRIIAGGTISETEDFGGAERVNALCRLSSKLLGEVFAAVEPEKPRLSLTPELLELHQVQIPILDDYER